MLDWFHKIIDGCKHFLMSIFSYGKDKAEVVKEQVVAEVKPMLEQDKKEMVTIVNEAVAKAKDDILTNLKTLLQKEVK